VRGIFSSVLGADKRVASCVLCDSFYNLLHDESADTRARKRIVLLLVLLLLCCVELSCVVLCCVLNSRAGGAGRSTAEHLEDIVGTFACETF